MSYEEIKNSIEQDLINQGFNRVEEDLIRTDIRQHQIIINNVPSVQEEKQEIKFVCLGEGAIDDQVSIGYALYVNSHNVTDLWCTSLEDFKYLLKTLII